MLETAADMHRLLWYDSRLAVAQGFGGSMRDRELLHELSLVLKISDQQFVAALDASGITAQSYLMALLKTMEPLAQMFLDVWRYCERSATTKSANARELRWDFKINDAEFQIDFEAFRKYTRLAGGLPSEGTFRELANAFANEACRFQESYPTGAESTWLPDPPLDADKNSVLYQVYELTKLVAPERQGGTNAYVHFNDVRAKLCGLVAHPHEWQRPAFSTLTDLINQCRVGPITANDILSLPFWRFRWQMYELWCLVKTVALLEPRGFRLSQSPDGVSAILEPNVAVVVASKDDPPEARLLYQPRYENSIGKAVQPDIVLSSGLGNGDGKETSFSEVLAIVECKQRAEPVNTTFRKLRHTHFQDVCTMYDQAHGTNGLLAMLNYDSLDFDIPSLGERLMPNFRPDHDPETRLQSALLPVLQELCSSPVARSTAVVVDGSGSVQEARQALRSWLHSLASRHDVEKTLFWAAEGVVHALKFDQVDGKEFAGEETEKLFELAIDAARTQYPNCRVLVLTDLEPTDEIFLSLRRNKPRLEFIVRVVDR